MTVAEHAPPALALGRPKIDDDLAQTLRELNAIARTLRGAVPAGDPRRLASEEFSALLAKLRDDGFNMFEVARVLGTSYDTLRARLARHGYKHQPPSQRRYQGGRRRPVVAAAECSETP